MPYIQSDGARLYYEEAGTGTPIVFCHEFSGDLWSWEKQIQHFSRRYRCIAFNARGYPPSEVPARLYEEGGLAEVLKGLRKAENRIRLKTKNPRAFEDFCRRFMQHSAQGCAHITRRVQGRRVSLFSMERALKAMKVPSLVI